MYTLLGHFYAQEARDVERAKKCYQKAVKIDPCEAESGEALCKIYAQEGKVREQ